MFKVFSDQKNANQNDPRFHLTPIRRAKIKETQGTIQVEKDVEKEEQSSISGGIPNWHNNSGNYSGGSSKNQKKKST